MDTVISLPIQHLMSIALDFLSLCLKQESADFFHKGEMINILGLEGQTVSIETTYLCRHQVNNTLKTSNEWVWLCANKTLLIKTGRGPDWTPDPEFTDPLVSMFIKFLLGAEPFSQAWKHSGQDSCTS